MGQRGPAPLPANVHRLGGNASKLSAARLLDGVNPDVEIPDFPLKLLADAKKEWLRLTPHLEKLGLISQLDRAAFALYCQEWARWLWAEREIAKMNKLDKVDGDAGLVWDTPSGYKQMSVLLMISNRASANFMKAAAEFGLTPSARARVKASEGELNQQGGLPGVEPKPDLPKVGWDGV